MSKADEPEVIACYFCGGHMMKEGPHRDGEVRARAVALHQVCYGVLEDVHRRRGQPTRAKAAMALTNAPSMTLSSCRLQESPLQRRPQRLCMPTRGLQTRV